jgi:MFS family permease
MISAVFQIPQRFELVYDVSPLQSGIKLIPYTIGVPLGSAIASKLAEITKAPVIFIILGGAILQIVGFALMGTLPTTLEIPRQIYAYEIIASLGYGMNIAMLLLLVPFSVQPRDRGKFCSAISTRMIHLTRS